MHSGRGNLPDFGALSGVEQLTVFGLFWLVAVVAGFGPVALLPGIGLAPLVVVSGLTGAIGATISTRAMGRAHARRRDLSETEYCNLIEAEKQKKIGAMRRAHSKVPKVTRPARKGE